MWRVVAVVVPLYVAQDLFVFLTLLKSEGMKWYSGFGKWGIELWVTIWVARFLFDSEIFNPFGGFLL